MSTLLELCEPMAPTTLLHYLPLYRALVCLPCGYAVQPSAIARHLKEIHRIHRGNRRPYMQYVSGLLLNEAKDVIESSIDGFPVPYLPVQEGFLCRHEGCAYLCASLKRMKRHWTAVHGRSGEDGQDWQPAPLQSFFSGNLLHYFTDPKIIQQNNVGSGLCLLETLGQLDLPLDEDDIFLLRHYVTSTCFTIAIDDETQNMWQTTIPQLALQNLFLMHGLLACAALHLAHLNPSKQRGWMIKAIKHHDVATQPFQSAINSPTSSNCSAVLAYSHLLCIYCFSLEQDDEGLLLARENATDILPPWLYFIRNGCSMLCDFWDYLEQSSVRPLVDAWEHPIPGIVKETEVVWMNHLQSLIPAPDSENVWPEQVTQIYRENASPLAYAFSCSEALGEKTSIWDILRIWPVVITKDFTKLLSLRHPAALILLAHYCILLHKIELHWYLDGRAKSLMSAILKQLDHKWYDSIKLPLEGIPNGYQHVPINK